MTLLSLSSSAGRDKPEKASNPKSVLGLIAFESGMESSEAELQEAAKTRKTKRKPTSSMVLLNLKPDWIEPSAHEPVVAPSHLSGRTLRPAGSDLRGVQLAKGRAGHAANQRIFLHSGMTELGWMDPMVSPDHSSLVMTSGVLEAFERIADPPVLADEIESQPPAKDAVEIELNLPSPDSEDISAPVADVSTEPEQVTGPDVALVEDTAEPVESGNAIVESNQPAPELSPLDSLVIEPGPNADLEELAALAASVFDEELPSDEPVATQAASDSHDHEPAASPVPVAASVAAVEMTAYEPDSPSGKSSAPARATAHPSLLSRSWDWFCTKQANRSKHLRLEETVSLGEKRIVALIQVEGRRFLVGGGPSGVSLLTQLDGEADFSALVRQKLGTS